MAFGGLFSLLKTNAKGGSTANCEYIAKLSKDDVIILGSSRATHHYIPQIIEDSLGMSCYNCGEEGNGVVLAYGRLRMLTNRYKPKLIIYEIHPGYDYGVGDPNSKYLGYLRPYYNESGIKAIFDDFDDELSCVKMNSQMYQNTSRLLPDLLDNVFYRDNMKGYEPLQGKLNPKKIKKRISEEFKFDELKFSYLEKIIVLAKKMKIPILFSISPKYNSSNELSYYKPALQLCEKYGVYVANHLDDCDFVNQDTLFQDASHLNSEGAEIYTRKFSKELKGIISSL